MRRIHCLLAFIVLLAACGREHPHTTDVAALSVPNVPLNPNDAAWNRAPDHVAKLMLQDLVEPRLMKASTSEVRVRSLTNSSEIAFRLTWKDPELNDLPGAGRFVDACAVQVPSKLEANAPEPQMGQAAGAVQIAYWRADWQASMNGRGDTIRDLYPNASVDHYPFQANSLEQGSPAQREMSKRYSPASAAGNRRGGPRESPVEDLVAEGPGTTAPAKETTSRGQGARTKDGWSVVIIRRMPDGLAGKTRTQVAFAVWEGSQQEAGARKMRTGWIPLSLRQAQ